MPQPNDLRLLAGEARRLASSADTLSIVLAGPPEGEERSASTLDRRDLFTRDDIRNVRLGKRDEKVLRGKPR